MLQISPKNVEEESISGILNISVMIEKAVEAAYGDIIFELSK